VRPRGEVRQALSDAAQALAAAKWREMAMQAQVGFCVARETVKNMARAGELVPAGSRRVPGARRPMTVYAPVRQAVEPDGLGIDAAMRAWR